MFQKSSGPDEVSENVPVRHRDNRDVCVSFLLTYAEFVLESEQVSRWNEAPHQPGEGFWYDLYIERDRSSSHKEEVPDISD